MTDTLNPHRVKALELAQQSGGAHAEVVARATAYHSFLTGAAAASGGAATTKPASDKGATADPKAGASAGTTANKPAAEKPAAEKPAGGKGATADPKAGAGTTANKPAAEKPAGGKADPKANGATAPKPAATGKGTPPSAQSVPADTKAPGGKNTYADVVAMLHKVQNGPAGRPECFKILLEDGGGAKSVRDLKPAYYDSVVEACTNVIADDGAGSAEPPVEDDPLGDVAGGGEQPDMGV